MLRDGCWLFQELLIVTTATAAGADVRPSPHRYIPARNLIAYFEFDGLDAHADAWERTEAHAALVKTKAGAMTREPIEWSKEKGLRFEQTFSFRIFGLDFELDPSRW
jgi:hypothetical protein